MKSTSIITGDIIASRKLPVKSRERLFSDIGKFLAALRSEGRLEAYAVSRGDSIQCLVKNKEEALRSALMIRAWQKSYTIKSEQSKTKSSSQASAVPLTHLVRILDIRLSIGIGEVDFLKKTNLAHSDGEAFHLSGLGLDRLKNTSDKMMVQTRDKKFDEFMRPVMFLLDAVLEKWTSSQAEIILLKLKNYKEEQIAHKIGISQSAVNQRAKSSQWKAIDELLIWFEKTIKAW